MVSKLDLQIFMSEFESHCMPHSYGLVLHLSKKKSFVNYKEICTDQVFELKECTQKVEMLLNRLVSFIFDMKSSIQVQREKLLATIGMMDNSKSIWDHSTEWMVLVRWPKWFKTKNKLISQWETIHMWVWMHPLALTDFAFRPNRQWLKFLKK